MILSHQSNVTRSHPSTISAVPNPDHQRKITIDANSNVSTLQRQSNIRPNHAAHVAAGRVRKITVVTHTSSSEADSEKNDADTAVAGASSSGGVHTTHAEKGLVNITSSCASRIRQLASKRPNPDAMYLRLYVDAGGCSGFQYKFLLLSEDDSADQHSPNDDEEDGAIDPEEDVVFEKDGMRVVIDHTSLELLQGSTIDYVQEMIRSSFAVVGNPQSESACGCGSSFAVKNFESNPALD